MEAKGSRAEEVPFVPGSLPGAGAEREAGTTVSLHEKAAATLSKCVTVVTKRGPEELVRPRPTRGHRANSTMWSTAVQTKHCF